VPGLTKNAASLRKNGEALVFHCWENADERQQAGVVNPSANEPDVRNQLISESDVCDQASESQPAVSEPEFSPSTFDPDNQPPSVCQCVPSVCHSEVSNPYIPMEFNSSYYNSTTRSSILFVGDIQQSDSFGNTLDLDELREVAPLASTRIEPVHQNTWQRTSLPVEKTLDMSEQPAVPDSPIWRIVVEASKREKILLTDSMGFK
jgi:hypothetical protein